MKSQDNGRFSNVFFLMLMLSFVGNICADYGIIWYSIAKLNADNSTKDLSIFYVGQSVGIILLSHLLNSYLERFNRKILAIIIDVTYCISLIAVYAFFHFEVVTPGIVFAFAAVSSALNAVHKGSVGLAAIKQMSKNSGELTDWVAKYFATLHVPFIFATALSGFLYKFYGIEGCLILALVTFIPLPYFYLKIFKDDVPNEKYNFIENIKKGFNTFVGQKALLHTAISISILNIPTSVFPGMIGIGFAALYPNDPHYASIAISISILVSILLLKPIGRLTKNWELNKLILYSSLPMIVLCGLGYYYSNPFFLTLIFCITCIGSSARNVVSGSLRVTLVEKENIGGVNTLFQSVLHMGQVVGAVVVVNQFSSSIDKMITGILIFTALSILYSYISLYKAKRTA